MIVTRVHDDPCGYCGRFVSWECDERAYDEAQRARV
jgi:hypothetical protein